MEQIYHQSADRGICRNYNVLKSSASEPWPDSRIKEKMLVEVDFNGVIRDVALPS